MGSMSPKAGTPVTRFLTPDEERALIDRWSADGDADALDRLVAAHRPLVRALRPAAAASAPSPLLIFPLTKW